jgi:cytoskeletal protein RodZ
MNGNFNGLGEKITMTEVDANDHTYTDGKLYTYSTRLKFVGLYNYTFTAADINARTARGDPAKLMKGPQITSINEPPRLDWAQDWGFITDGLNPDTGFTDTNFTFKIVYTDILNESPANGFPKLYIDMNGNGSVTDPQDKVVPMLPVNPKDNTYDDGKIYYYNSTFLVGTYKYMVYVEDLLGLSAQTPIKNGPTVIAKGKPPVLATTGEPGYITDGVSPTFGADTTLFNFRVKYSDPDGDMPLAAYPKVGIDMNRDKNITANEKFVMSQDDTKDTNTKDGKIYKYSASFSTLGLYKYQFEAFDKNGSPSNVLTFPGVNVNSTNRAPHMAWSGSVGFEADGLDPEAGNANSTVFHYQVIYTDPDNDRPATNYPKVWIDTNLDGLESINEWFNMTDTNPASSDYTNGKKYEYNRTLPLVGTYSYRFQALDVKNSPANGDPIVKKSGPIVSVQARQLPILSFVGVGNYNGTGVSPAKGSLDTMFVYKVKYTDIQNFTPGQDYPRIYIDTDGDGNFSGPSDIMQVMQPEDATQSVVNGKVYVFKTKLPTEGTNIAYKFKAQDALGVAATGTGSIYDQVFKGPTVIINKAPLLQFIGSGAFANKGVDPSQAVTNSTFTYRVTYKDPEGDKPKDSKVYLRIDIDQNKVIDPADLKITMTEANLQDQNYAGAKEYTSQYKFTAAGSYGYRFEASDAFNNTAGGPASADYLPGPTVTEPVPNRAPTLTFLGELNYENIGVNPISAVKGTKFTFRVKYIDLDNDAPGNMTLTIGGQKYPMSAMDATTNYAAGKGFTVDVPLSKAQTYTYTFDVKNAIGQTASLGPVNGPVVTEKVAQSKAQVLPDFLWLIVLIIVALIVAIIGYLIGARRKREPEHEYRPASRRPREPTTRRRPDGLKETPMVPLTSAEVDEAPKKTISETEEPGPAETTDAGGAKSDLKASSEQPAATIEDAKKPAEKPGPPIAAETKTDLKEQHGAVEAPASDKDVKEGETTAKPEEKKDDVDGEIDSILAKLEK